MKNIYHNKKEIKDIAMINGNIPKIPLNVNFILYENINFNRLGLIMLK